MDGLYSKNDPRSQKKKATELNMKMQMNPESWKAVTKSPEALKGKLFEFFLTLIWFSFQEKSPRFPLRSVV